MVDPLMLLTTRARRSSLRRARVQVPTEVPGTDAIFLVLRRMRAPLIALIVVFAVSVFGLASIEGMDSDGNPVRMTMFDAFYFISYTATTIGFGELTGTFTTAQRMWVTGSIYSSVIGWAYAIGTLFALLQDQGFREAIRVQRFRRRVRRIKEPFHIVAGYGQAGRLICQALDHVGRRAAVIDRLPGRIERLEFDQLAQDVPGVEADACNPGVLGLAGLASPHCDGVLAVTDDDRTNLAIVMAVRLLRPELPVIARCTDRGIQQRMTEFEPSAIINPFDRYGEYLVLALRRPVTFQLLTWLMSPSGSELEPPPAGLADGYWVVSADGAFGHEVAQDLRGAGLEVEVIDPAAVPADLTGAVGFVAGTDDDTMNLSLAAHARLEQPDLFLSVRQASHTNAPLLAAFGLESVFVPTELVARECLARVITPIYWGFLDHLLGQDDAWSQWLRDRLVDQVGCRTPGSLNVRLDDVQAPAVARWLTSHELTLDDLLRHPDDREATVAAMVVALIRGKPDTSDAAPGTVVVVESAQARASAGLEATARADPGLDPQIIFSPEGSTALQVGDELVLLGRESGFQALFTTLFQDSAVEYVASGRRVPTTWLWRVLKHGRGSQPSGKSAGPDTR